MDERIVQIREETDRLKKQLVDLNNTNADTVNDNGDQAKYELLQKRDQDMTAFMDKFDETRDGILKDMNSTRSVIVGLLEHIGKGLEDQANIPTQEGLGDMVDADAFKKKNYITAQKTMVSVCNQLFVSSVFDSTHYATDTSMCLSVKYRNLW